MHNKETKKEREHTYTLIIIDCPGGVYFQTDARYSLHRSDNLFGVLDPREDDVVAEFGITTLSRALKVTHFNRTVHIACHPGCRCG